MWLVQNLNLKQLHFSFFLANHIKTKLCDMKNVCKENPVGLSTTSRDASVGLCRKLYFSKYKYPFESDETFITEFGSQGLAGQQSDKPSYLSLFCPEFNQMPNFFRTFCFHLGIVCFCNPMACSGISRERPNLFSPHFQTLYKTLFWCQFWSQTNTCAVIIKNRHTNCSL